MDKNTTQEQERRTRTRNLVEEIHRADAEVLRAVQRLEVARGAVDRAQERLDALKAQL